MPAFLILLMVVGALGAPAAGGTSIERIYVVPMSHLDIGFTDAPSAVAAGMVAAVNGAVRQAEENPAYVWNVETFWQLDQWLATDPSDDRQERLAELVRAGRLGVGAAYVTPHSAIMSEWALERLCEPAGNWARRQGLRLEWAVLNDVPGHPPDLPRYLARAGVKYLVLGVNQSFTPALPNKFCNTPFWWEAPSGERVLTWISADGYTDAFTQMGFDPDTARFFARERFPSDDPMAVMRQGIRDIVSRYAQRGYQHDAVLVLYAFDNWGTGPSAKLPRFARQWNGAGEGPQIVLATPEAFFRDLLAGCSEPLPTYRGGFGGAWDRVKLAVPTSVRRMRAGEDAFRQAGLTAADPGVRNFLALCGHTFGLGPGWPGLLTEEQMLQHNRDQADMVRALPGKAQPWPIRGEPTPLSVGNDGALKPNGLYLADGVDIWQFVGRTLTPLPSDAWSALPPRRTGNGMWQFRHRVDRRKLPDRAQVVWAWPVKTPAGELRPRVRIASGWMQLPDELLDGQFHKGWFSAWATRLDGVEIEADVPLAFCVVPEHFPNWVFALCLTQSREASFKGGQTRRLTFEEAYPGEQDVLEYTIEVRPLE
ncbi:MAG: hypothetical protein KKI02_11325 [Planctomycetes bacterium]|nr:hypothetical protein [Planctomycetota bacterium]